eukprot:79652-Prorocentrum_minimum.AAC.3
MENAILLSSPGPQEEHPLLQGPPEYDGRPREPLLRLLALLPGHSSRGHRGSRPHRRRREAVRARALLAVRAHPGADAQPRHRERPRLRAPQRQRGAPPRIRPHRVSSGRSDGSTTSGLSVSGGK